jgi:3-deoxy-D-arabino-heptulosonate 7-phosphate (DAHP) synthase
VTDACIDWALTEKTLKELGVLLKPVVQARKSA